MSDYIKNFFKRPFIEVGMPTHKQLAMGCWHLNQVMPSVEKEVNGITQQDVVVLNQQINDACHKVWLKETRPDLVPDCTPTQLKYLLPPKPLEVTIEVAGLAQLLKE